MSHAVADRIWNSELEPREKLVALALSRFITHISGFQCPINNGRLCQLTTLSRAELDKTLRRLEAANVIDITQKPDSARIARFTAQYQGR